MNELQELQTRFTRVLSKYLIEYHGDVERAKKELFDNIVSVIEGIQQHERKKRRKPYLGPDNFFSPENQAKRLVDTAWEQILADPDQWI